MNIKSILRITLIATIAISTAACSSRPVDPSVPTGRIYGKVLKVQETPERCEKPSAAGGTILGALIGGGAGSLIGGGKGRTAAIITGALIGGKIGSNSNKDKALVCKKRGYLFTLAYLNNFNEQKYVVQRFEKSMPVGKLIEFRLKY